MCTPLMALFFVALVFSFFSLLVSCYDEAPWQPILYDYYQIDLGELGEHHGFGVPPPEYRTFGSKSPVPREAIVEVINNLGFKLLAIHNQHNENNIAISPYGAFSILAALSEGLRGESAHEILHAAQIPKDKHVLRVGLRDIHRHLKSYFIPEEGFLAGLTLNLNNITLRSEYEDVLHFYGFDYSSFNNALYPEPPTTKKPTEGTTLETGLGLTEGTKIPSTPKADVETITYLGDRRGPSIETTTTTTPEVLTTVLTTTKARSASRDGEITIELGNRGGSSAATTATTKTDIMTTILATTEGKQETTTKPQPITVVTIPIETTTLAMTTAKVEILPITTETPKIVSTIITTVSLETLVTDLLKTSVRTEKPASTSKETQTTIEARVTTPMSTTTEKPLSPTTPDITTIPESTTKLPETTTTEMISTAKEITTETTLITTTTKTLETTLETTTVPLQTGTVPKTTNTGRTTREITTVMDISESPTQTTVSTEAAETASTEIISKTESLETTTFSLIGVENDFVTATTTPAPFEDPTQLDNEETTTPFFFGTTSEFQDLPLDQNNFDFNYNYDVNGVPPVYDDNTVANNVMPNPPVESGNSNTNLKRRVRSVVDYIIARFYDDHSHYVPPVSQRPHYVPQEPLTFAVYGRYRETGVNFMKYDTVLPYFFVPNLNAMALSFPLDSSRYYLLLLLPLRDDGVDQLICDLRLHGNLRYIIGNLRLTHIMATIPSFMLKGYVTLTPTLQKLGIRKVFEPRQADFSPMTNVTDIYVTNIEQAVTVTIRNYLDPSSQRYKNYRQYPPVNFKADHPFLYFVVDSDLHVALMVGKVVNPLNSRIS